MATTQAPEASTIVVPIRASLLPVQKQVESQLQRHVAGDQAERGINVHFDATREPITLGMIGAGLHATTRVRYSLQACRGTFPCISCGLGEEPREAEIHLQTKLDWLPTWRLRSTTRVLPVHYARPCEITWLGIDITPRFIAPVVDQQLADAAKAIDREMPGLTNMQRQAQQIWSALQAPIELAPRTWLSFQPDAVSLTPISGNGPIATATLTLRAATRIVVGEKPAIVAKPLPPLTTSATPPATAMRVPFDLQVSYGDASQLAAAQTVGKKLVAGGKPLVIEQLRIVPALNGRVSVEAMVNYRGGALRNYHGMVYLDGTPQFDRATSSIVLPDLDYTLDPRRRGFLTAIAERVAHDVIRERLRGAARFSLARQIASARDSITQALNRNLAAGVVLHGRADGVEIESVSANGSAIAARLVATGSAAIDIRG